MVVWKLHMNEVARTATGRRHVQDGTFTVLLLVLAVVQGYVLLPATTTPSTAGVSMVVIEPPPSHVSSLPTTLTRPTPEATIVSTATAAPAPAPPEVISIPKQAPVPAPPPATAPAPAPIAPAVRGEWPVKVTGRVLGPDATPMANVSLVAGGDERRTDAEGAFTLERVPADTVVIVIKGDRAWIPYRTEVEAALAAGAQRPVIIKDFAGLIADLKARGIYTVARIVTFKDNVLANHRPELAITDTRTGKPWIDNEKLAWVDPFREEVWSYNIAIAKEAASKGFDEIQFDYVRFPTDGRLSAARYSRPNNKETRLPTIAGFLKRARKELGPLGVFVAADVFGYTAFNENDTDIGQRIEELAPNLDYICPMVYPSGYHVGIPGFRNPVTNPYEVVNQTVKLIRKRSAGLAVQVRPWLQDFKDYAFDKRIFGVTEIRAQIRGTDEGGGVGWMLWNPRNDYTGAALRPKGPIASR